MNDGEPRPARADEAVTGVVEHLLPAQDELGEGPIWDHRDGRLRWVDIERRRLHAYDPAEGAWSVVETPVAFTALGLRAAGGFVVAGRDGFGSWDDANATYTPLVDPEAHLPDTRFNDGAVDPAGRFWAGTMHLRDHETPANALYRLHADGRWDRVLERVGISNGVDWSPDGRRLYFTDTVARTIDAFDFDAASGAPTNRRAFARFGPDEGAPDGLCVDDEGCVWSCLWGGGTVIRIDPSGARIAEYAVPASQVTSCAFGGRGLDVLYLTTARAGLGPDALEREPLAGDLFRLRTRARGRRAHLHR